MPFHYHLFGLNIASEIECPELFPALPGEAVDIQIMLDVLPERIEESLQLAHPALVHPKVQFGREIVQIEIDEVARYRVENGSKILVSPFPGVANADVRTYLLGTAMGIVLHQRRLLPLHVCAVAVDGQVHAFCGQSGAGKSTLAADFHRHGYAILSDDVGVAVPMKDGGVLFQPGFPRIKLWRDTLVHFGIDEEPLIPDVTRADKFHLALHGTFCRQPLPMKRLYQLERGAPLDTPRIEPRTRPQGLGLLIEHTYRTELVRDAGDAKTHLQLCARVAQSIKCFKLTRPWNLERAEESFEFIQTHMNTK